MARRARLAPVLRSEWRKLHTSRGTVIAFGIGLFALAGLGPLATFVTARAPAEVNQLRDIEPLMLINTGLGVTAFIVAVVAIGFGAGEFRSGLSRITFAAVPRRLPVLWAKVLVVAVVTAGIAAVGLGLAHALGMRFLVEAGLPTSSLADPQVLRAQLGTIVDSAGNAAMGVALGMWLRSTGLAVALHVGGVMVAPALLATLLPEPVRPALRFLPAQAAEAFTTHTPDPALLPPLVGAAVYAAWLGLTLTGAAAHLRRHDV